MMRVQVYDICGIKSGEPVDIRTAVEQSLETFDYEGGQLEDIESKLAAQRELISMIAEVFVKNGTLSLEELSDALPGGNRIEEPEEDLI